MSEQGWRDFLAAGLTDWVVTHGGAMAVYPVGSLAAAVRLAEAVAAVPGVQESGTVLTAAPDRLSVRLQRGVFFLEAHHVDLARAVSAVAAEQGATAARAAVHTVQLAIAGRPEALDVGFWRTVLGYVPLAEDNATDPLGHGSTVWMQELDPDKPLRHAMHVDVSMAREHAQAWVEAAVAAGGSVVYDDEAPRVWILADPAGNKVCVASWPDGAEPATGSGGG